MPAGSPERTQARRDEIVAACARLYETMSFKDITLKEIAVFTTFTRPSIYNYFQTKEEIFLALLQKEYELWTEELDALTPTGSDPKRELAEGLARTLERREVLLRLLSTNLSEMESNSRMERLVEFKVAYGASIEAADRCLNRFCPEMTDARREDFLFSFLPLIYGIYPYAVVSDKQKEAMEKARTPYRRMSVYELALMGIKQLLGTGG